MKNWRKTTERVSGAAARRKDIWNYYICMRAV